MSMVTITFKIPTDTYKQAKGILSRYGLTIEQACILFLEETVARGDLPFTYTQQDIEESKRIERLMCE